MASRSVTDDTDARHGAPVATPLVRPERSAGLVIPFFVQDDGLLALPSLTWADIWSDPVSMVYAGLTLLLFYLLSVFVLRFVGVMQREGGLAAGPEWGGFGNGPERWRVSPSLSILVLVVMLTGSVLWSGSRLMTRLEKLEITVQDRSLLRTDPVIQARLDELTRSESESDDGSEQGSQPGESQQGGADPNEADSTTPPSDPDSPEDR